MTMLKLQPATVTLMILLAAVARLLPHAPNFTPIAAMALFAGAHFADRRLAFLVPLAAMFLSDMVIGPDHAMPVIYACFVLTVCMGMLLRGRAGLLNVAAMSLAGSVLFFLATNFAVWYGASFYPQTPEGLMTCYVAAIPFFGNTLAGDLLFNALLFGGYALLKQGIPALRRAA
jgi:hypothetical protein